MVKPFRSSQTPMWGAGLLFSAVLAGSAASVTPADPQLIPAGRKVLDYLASGYGQRVLSGYNVYSHTPDDYEQTGKQAAVWGRDIQWLGDPNVMADHVQRHGYLLTLHWHWHFDDDSAWTRKRKTPVDLGRMITPGTPDHDKARREFDAVADQLRVFADREIPILWRPFHEIDGGWFFWTDKDHPENTAALWRMLFDYLTYERDLHNLIWVYSAGVGDRSAQERMRYYPGADYVDISGIDIYGVDPRVDTEPYWHYFRTLEQVSPGKMLAMGEGDAIPDPEKLAGGDLPRWLWVLPWWGTPAGRRPVDWALPAMRHPSITTLEELPAFDYPNLTPQVGILEPRDDGSAWFEAEDPVWIAYAADRDGSVTTVEFHADGRRIGVIKDPPYSFTWTGAEPGSYTVHAVAEDDRGNRTESNRVRTSIGLHDLARGRPVTASSGEHPNRAVDGDYFTPWISAKSDREWISVDLTAGAEIDRVNLLWGWKIHPSAFTVETAHTDPGNPESWTEVHRETERPYQTWEATDRIRFPARQARYIRVSCTQRAGHQTWAGYQLMALEVPVVPRQTPSRADLPPRGLTVKGAP